MGRIKDSVSRVGGTVAAGFSYFTGKKSRSLDAVDRIAHAAEKVWSRILVLLKEKGSWDPTRLLMAGPAKELQKHVLSWAKIEERSREDHLPPTFARMRELWGLIAEELLLLVEIPQQQMQADSWDALRSHMEAMSALEIPA